MTKEKKLKPDLPSGFVDRKGNELILKDKLTDIIKKNFQLYGYEQISTPSFEVSENIIKPPKCPSKPRVKKSRNNNKL